ncbi:MAG: putative metal transport system ATP-binding protein [Candidatus Hydrogenedentota bacterium]
MHFGEFEALRDVSVSVPEGSYVAIIGPNGAGKTTLLNLILGLQMPTRGTVQVFGGAPEALRPDALGYVPQLKTLDRTFPAQAIELVITGMRRNWPWRVTEEERNTALDAMKRAGVKHVANRAISRLSGGELQRVYLARSLVRRPKLLVLDEPGAGMDLAGEAEMYHILERYQKESGATVLMITHDWEGARVHATHVLLLNRTVIAFGPPEDAGAEYRLLEVFGYAGHKAVTHGKGDAT